jgi:hypothetical protein
LAEIFDEIHLPNLQYLSVPQSLRPTSAKFLEYMPQLRVLDLAKCNISEITVKDFLSVPCLEVLNLSSVRVDLEQV